MIAVSYIFISDVEHDHLEKEAKNMLANVEANIRIELLEPQFALSSISQLVRNRILKGDDADVLVKFITDLTEDYPLYEEHKAKLKDIYGIYGIYGIFEIFENKYFVSGSKRPPAGYLPMERPWYKAAVEANGEIAMTYPYTSMRTNNTVITYAQRIFDNNNMPLGVICLDVPIEAVSKYIVSTKLSKNGFGLLVNDKMEFMAHPSPEYIGKSILTVNDEYKKFAETLKQEDEINGYEITNYLNEASIVHFNKLKNGWYLGLMTPKSEYYKSVKMMASFLIVLGIILAGILCLVLIGMINAKEKADIRAKIILDSMPLGVSFWDKNVNCLDCNKKLTSMFGVQSKQEFINKSDSFSPKYQPDGTLSKEKVMEKVRIAYSEGICCFEWLHKKSNGELLPCEQSLIRVEYSDENILIMYTRDSSEIKQATMKINEQSRLLHTTNQVASALLANIDNEIFERSLLNSFEIMGNSLKVDRIQIWHNKVIDGEMSFVLSYGWLSDYGKKCAPLPIGFHVPYRKVYGWEERFLRGECINSSFSALSKNEQDFFAPYDIQFIIVIPMFLDDQFWGFFSINDCRAERNFSKEEIAIINSAVLMIGNAINRHINVVKMREAEGHGQLMLDTMPLSAHIFDKNLKHIDCNLETLRLFEIHSKQECDDAFLDFSPEYQPDGQLSKEKARELIRKTFKIGYKRLEWLHKKPNGELLPCEVTLVRAKYKEDFIVIAYSRDLREIKTKELELKRIAHWYMSILDTIPLPISVTDMESKWTFVNIAVENFLKVKRADIMSKPCRNWNANICQTNNCGIECAKRGINRTYFSHSNSTYKVDVEILKDMDGKPSGYVEIVEDVTELQKMMKLQTEAEAISRAKSAFLAKMSHEIRTPMNAILGIAEIQMRNRNLTPEAKEAICKIYDSGEFLLQIINDVLDLSKIEAGKMDLMPVKYEVVNLINDTVQLNIMRNSNPIEFKVQVDENIPCLLIGDEIRIKQILNNLLSNAFKYTKKGEILFSISVEKLLGDSDVQICFRVSDTGEGMTKEQLEHLYDEYTRFNLEPKHMVQGTGLGMNIARNLINAMNGTISVDSEIGKGSTFTVQLPQKIADAKILGKQMAENLQTFRLFSNSRKKQNQQITHRYMSYGKVLIVDDVDTNLYVMKGLLVPYGLSIDTAVSGFEAIEKIKSGKQYDIIFMDHMMPEMDGIEATKLIRDLNYTHPIVALTANAIAGQAEKFLKSGFNDFISKPVDTRLLNATLNKFVHDKKAEIETMNKTMPEKNMVLLTIFVRDAKKAINVMSEILKDIDNASTETLGSFAISAHSMKSALFSIGREDTSEKALELEKAAKEFDKNYIKDNSQDLLADLQAIILQIEAESTERNVKVDEDPLYLHEQLKNIVAACTSYDEKAASISLENLEKMVWTKETKSFLSRVSEHLLRSNFEEAAGIITAFLHKNKKLYI
jgi:signal transduction histidine kinase/DNA-binding response OmpR family regulator